MSQFFAVALGVTPAGNPVLFFFGVLAFLHVLNWSHTTVGDAVV